MAARRSLLVNLAGAAVAGAACAVLGLIPAASNLEQDVGLRWLFQLRGPIKPSDDVVLVLINERAASRLSLPADVRFHRCEELAIGAVPGSHIGLPTMTSRWPRCMHALLVNKLTRAGASVIAFDMLFAPRPPLPGSTGDLHALQDETMATAFASSGRVVVAQGVKSSGDKESIAPLSAVVESAVLGRAPFSLVHGGSGRVDRFVAFQETGWATPGLPALALQAFAMNEYPPLAKALERHSSDGDLLVQVSGGSQSQSMPLHLACQLMRKLFRDDLALGDRVIGELSRTLAANPASSEVIARESVVRALISMYQGEGSRWINYYGAAGSIPTFAYDRIIEAEADWLSSIVKGRAVFVGYGDTVQFEQSDHFPTAYSTAGQPDHSGVEIAATAFANLLQDRSIRTISFASWLALIFLAAAGTMLICRTLPNRRAAIATAALLLCGGAGVLHAFAAHDLWIAYILPMFVATPVGMISAFTWKFADMRRDRDRMRAAVRIFVPRDVAQKIEQNASLTDIEPETIECGCVATDAANFTPLSESMSSHELAGFLNHYFRALFEPVAAHGGFVSDIVGDAMLAIWKDRGPHTRMQMLQALLEMRDAAQDFNDADAGKTLMTRFGVDWGPATLTAVGALDHYEYRAVGDTVNTSARIQELNKKLGTRVLVSRTSLGDASDAFLIREVGTFLLRGKRVPIEICELMETAGKATALQRELADGFNKCRLAFFEGRTSESLAMFRELHVQFPDDGPIAFYIQSIESGVHLQQDALRVN